MTSQIEKWKEDFDVATAENWLDAMFGRGKMRVRNGYIPVAGKNCEVFGKSRLNKCISIFIFALGATSSLSAQFFEQSSSMYFQAGVGFYPYLTYGSAADASLASSGTSRFQLDWDVHLGWPITRSFYLVGGYDGVLDEISTSGTYSNQISSSLFSLGFRIYPFVHGLVLGADAGVSELDAFASWGYGFGGIVAWDFSPLGLNLEVGARTLYLDFNYPSPPYMFTVMPFIAIVVR